MSERTCPTEAELSRGFPDPDATLSAHLATCDVCTRWWQDTTAAIALARELPTSVPAAAHREDVRTALLARVGRAPADVRRRWILPLVAAAAAAILVVHVWPTRPPRALHAQRGTVHAHAGATYTLASASPDEIVRLRDGTIDIDVQPLQAGERFRVIVGVDEVEVHGTSFEVVAQDDHLRAVRVVHGRVEVRHLGDPPTWIGRGESWTSHVETATVAAPAPAAVAVAPAPAPTPPSPPVPAPTSPHHAALAHVAPPVTPMPELAPAAPAPPATPDPQEAAFNTGWHAMQSNNFKAAAAAFARAVALDPDGALAEDAAFWNAVALSRLGHDGEAEIALRSFLGTFTKSTRAGEASAMLGWLLVAKGEVEEARERFDAAVGDPSPSVQKSAREGLKALDAKKR
jgi:TolA-binding protein